MRKHKEIISESYIYTYHWTQNFTLISNLDSKFKFNLRIFEKNRFEKICVGESQKFYLIWINHWILSRNICILCEFDSCMTNNIEIIKNTPMTHKSWPELNFEKNDPLQNRFFYGDFKYWPKNFWKPFLVPKNRPDRFLFENLFTLIRLRSCAGGSEISYVGILLTVLS